MDSASAKNLAEHLNPKSYSWCLLRYATLKLAIHNVTIFLNVIGIEVHELPTLSPIIHDMLKSLERWMELIKQQLNSFDSPTYENSAIYEQSFNQGANFNGPRLLKYQSMLDPENTPFM